MNTRKLTRRALGAAAIALHVTATTAFAQQPGRIRGQIEKADGQTFSLKLRGGSMLNVKVAGDVTKTKQREDPAGGLRGAARCV